MAAVRRRNDAGCKVPWQIFPCRGSDPLVIETILRVVEGRLEIFTDASLCPRFLPLPTHETAIIESTTIPRSDMDSE